MALPLGEGAALKKAPRVVVEICGAEGLMEDGACGDGGAFS